VPTGICGFLEFREKKRRRTSKRDIRENLWKEAEGAGCRTGDSGVGCLGTDGAGCEAQAKSETSK
jgi:hypothetical protein